MTKKDYIAIAAVVAASDINPTQRMVLINGLIQICQADNPNFDPIRFVAACRGHATDAHIVPDVPKKRSRFDA